MKSIKKLSRKREHVNYLPTTDSFTYVLIYARWKVIHSQNESRFFLIINLYSKIKTMIFDFHIKKLKIRRL